MVKETNKNLKTVNTEQTEIQLVWLSEQDTQYFAERLSKQLSLLAEPVNLFIELHGDLGSGKTTLVRYLLQALGVTGRIKSPTYAIVESYDEVRDASLKPLPVWHFDFYRFKDPLEWEEAGFRDIFAGPGIKLVEWPEMA
ncbi:MAG: tRNA (adenosine(37)-N6)-threonylcarbamoyltransferase complex ATPase subunit type 1 TsaE, partial [Polaromonas sp.]|nr:tRNA (adenosine(37)-N6)-threonylcarbamoyltransferase complex ATPase subunit type 1 TsaE [Polaromonas sp.]MBP7308162.1 tRNA (adenosine(37)-N6)-threonylcarbamoyltransferase complex ATPase subunit type 1 TsaE [Polaromonas sp.]MBP8873844.1 tRNA (adenosine(37)-N6)-threonylcarbamoyltransferase complex ATPase subunit type 1 TsaE [Polaromonas sp.]